MDGADEDYCGPPRLPFQDSSTSQRHRLPYQTFSNTGTQPPRHDPRLQGTFGRISSLDQQELDLYMRGQFNLNRELQMRRRFMREQHEQIFSRLLHSSQQSSTSTPLLRHQQSRQHAADQQTSPVTSPLLQSRQYGAQDFASPAGRRILQGDQAYLQRAAAQQLQQQELLRMMRSQVNGSSDHRFLELTSQISRQRSSSTASNEPTTEKQRKQSISSMGEKKRKRTDSSESETKSKAKHGAPEPSRKMSECSEKNQDSKVNTKEITKILSNVKEATEAKDDNIVQEKGSDEKKENEDNPEVIVIEEKVDEVEKPVKAVRPDEKKSDQPDQKMQCTEVIDVLNETKDTSKLSQPKDISLLLLASEEVDKNEIVLQTQNLPLISTIDRLQLLTAASQSIEAFENDACSNDGNYFVQDSELSTKATSDIHQEKESEMASPGDEEDDLTKEKLVIDENDSVIYIVKKMFPGFMYKLPILSCEPEYIENCTIVDSQTPLSELDITAGFKAQHRKNVDGLSSSYLRRLLNPSQEFAVTGPLEIPLQNETSKKPIVYKAPVDTWWPSNNTIRRERRLQGYRSDEDEDENKIVKIDNIPGLAPSMYERLSNHIEPGVLEKVPHCKIHQARVEQQKHHPNPGPLFCMQVTEAYSNEVMLCCSICHTWRHAACGGHYTKFMPHTSKDENQSISPVCDRCYKEKEIASEFPQAQARMKRQRIENLRRALSTTSVVRQFSFAKHGGTYKWPLGSVSATHIGGHTRSVHARHERSEKQWSELAVKLGNGLGYRPKERVKVRTRELERLIVSVEDAEGETDRHNMMLFLQNDSIKDHPVGFERSFRNFFDPAEDIATVEEENLNGHATCEAAGETSTNEGNEVEPNIHQERMFCKVDDIENQKDIKMNGHLVKEAVKNYESDVSRASSSVIRSTAGNDEHSVDSNSVAGSCTPSLEDDDFISKDTVFKKQLAIDTNVEPTDKDKNTGLELCDKRYNEFSQKIEVAVKKMMCANHGCRRKPRFDSVFCSDSCGVSALEQDLLCSFEYASDIHPSLLRT